MLAFHFMCCASVHGTRTLNTLEHCVRSRQSRHDVHSDRNDIDEDWQVYFICLFFFCFFSLLFYSLVSSLCRQMKKIIWRRLDHRKCNGDRCRPAHGVWPTLKESKRHWKRTAVGRRQMERSQPQRETWWTSRQRRKAPIRMALTATAASSKTSATMAAK